MNTSLTICPTKSATMLTETIHIKNTTVTEWKEQWSGSQKSWVWGQVLPLATTGLLHSTYSKSVYQAWAKEGEDAGEDAQKMRTFLSSRRCSFICASPLLLQTLTFFTYNSKTLPFSKCYSKWNLSALNILGQIILCHKGLSCVL